MQMMEGLKYTGITPLYLVQYIMFYILDLHKLAVIWGVLCNGL